MKINNDPYKDIKPAEPKAGKSDIKQEKPKTPEQVNDIVEISVEGRQKIKDSDKAFFDLERLQEQLKNSNEQAKAEADANKIRLKCQEIARRILKGDIVPDKDHKYLMKNDAGLYMQDTSLKMHNDNPKKHKRLSEDEENGEASETQQAELRQSDETPTSQSAGTGVEADAPSVE